MVTEAILTFFFTVAQAVISLLPSFSLDLIPATSSLAMIFAGISPFMPMTAFGVACGVFAAVQLLKLGSSGLNWVLRKFLIG